MRHRSSQGYGQKEDAMDRLPQASVSFFEGLLLYESPARRELSLGVVISSG